MHTSQKFIKAYTFIEMLISILLILLIFTTLVTTFQFTQNAYQNILNTSTAQDNLRYISTILERQILSCDKIYIVKDICYFRDMESSAYFNYYYCSNEILYKVKTDDQLNSIGQGSTSQLAINITQIKFTYLENRLRLYIETYMNEQMYSQTKDIPYGGKIVIIK